MGQFTSRVSVLAVSGSLRVGSANTGLVRMAERLAPDDLSVTVREAGGRSGGSHVQPSLVEILGLLGNTMVTEPPIMVASGRDRISSDGSTTDPEIEALVSARLDAIAAALAARTS